jgi:hypothetical protein
MRQREGYSDRVTNGQPTDTGRRRDWSEGNGAIFGLLAAMVVVMAVLAFTLNGTPLLVATGSSVTASGPTTIGQGGALPEAPRR